MEGAFDAQAEASRHEQPQLNMPIYGGKIKVL